jgi:hypothetical protein
VNLNDSFAWLATPAAVLMLGTAAIVEVAAFYIPGVDNLLDTLATPGAVIAGTIASAAVMTDVPPMLKWTAAVIAGGGVAGVTQGLTAMLRTKSTVFTGGLGNSAVATAELGGASLISVLALAAPVAALILVVLFFWLAFRLARSLAEREGHHSKERRHPDALPQMAGFLFGIEPALFSRRRMVHANLPLHADSG